jgi:2-oxoisovalerate dehydrogenase E1 component
VPPLGAATADEMTLIEAVNTTLAAALVASPDTLLFGEDIEEPKGGVFGLTKGLSERFPGRVTNAPLAEATIVGCGVGLAAAGARPIFEIQYIDFIGPGLNQLIHQAATLRWRTHPWSEGGRAQPARRCRGPLLERDLG